MGDQSLIEKGPIIHVVSTPIGNLEDITKRAIRVLNEADVIAAEDTRQVRKLLSHFGIHGKELISYYDHVEDRKAEQLVGRLLREGLRLALVSDAGTPCISDPGYKLIAKARMNGIRVSPIPGPSALTSALSVSGLPSDRFSFIGFLPTKDSALRDEVLSWRTIPGTIVLFEAPRRLRKTLKIIAEIYPAARIVIGRELTKIHEEVVSLTAQAAMDWALHHEALKGEATLMVQIGDEFVGQGGSQNKAGTSPSGNAVDKEQLFKEVKQALLKGATFKDLIQLYSGLNWNRKDLYNFFLDAKLDLKDEDD